MTERLWVKRLLMTVSVLMLIAFWTMQVAAKEMTVRGYLAQTVEAGGWLIIVDTDEKTEKYLLLNAKQFQKETWFHVGAEVEVTGVIKRDAVTVYQEGLPFQARTMRPLGKNKAMLYRKETLNAKR